MITTFKDILNKAKDNLKVIAVAVAEDEHVLETVKAAKKEKIADFILVGDKEKIISLTKKLEMKEEDLEIIDEKDREKATLEAVKLVKDKRAHMLMKGLVETKTLLRAVLNKEVGLRSGSLISHVGVFEVEALNRLIILTDAAFNIEPSLSEKVAIIKNSVILAKGLEIENPKVAIICAVEVVNEAMKATLDAASLSKMNDRGQIKGCLIDGPLALDNAISLEAAKHKGIESKVAGQADILLMPNIESGNVMYKTLTYLSKSKSAGILVGASAPVIITSRSDSPETKLNSIALASIL